MKQRKFRVLNHTEFSFIWSYYRLEIAAESIKLERSIGSKKKRSENAAINYSHDSLSESFE